MTKINRTDSTMLLSISAFVVTILTSVATNEFYITSYPNKSDCPGNEAICHTLPFYLSHKQMFFKDETTFTFLAGTHQLPSETISVQALVNITFRGIGNIIPQSNDSTVSESVLQCTEGVGGIMLLDCENVYISGLTINECSISNEAIPSTSLLIFMSKNVQLLNLSIHNSSSMALILHTVKDIVIKGSVFTRSQSTGILAFFRHMTTADNDDWLFEIIDTNATHNGANGIGIIFDHQTYTVNVKVESSHTVNNSKNFNVEANGSCFYTLTVERLSCKYARNLFGFRILHTHPSNVCLMEPSITVTNSHFTHNSFYCFAATWVGNCQGSLNVTSSTFTDNDGWHTWHIMQQSNPALQNQPFLKLVVTDITFQRNKADHDKISIVVELVSVNSIVMRNCTFTDNIGSAIELFNSVSTFHGEHVFRNNTNTIGGALRVTGISYIFVDEETRFFFDSNNAKLDGGAIYVSETNEIETIYCFYQPLQSKISRKTFTFRNNTAGRAGSALYGDSTSQCILDIKSTFVQVSNWFFMQICSFEQQPGESVISSIPHQICFCENYKKHCDKVIKHYTAYPGETITFSIAAVGNNEGLTTGTVEIKSMSQVTVKKLTKAACTSINHTLLAGDNSIDITMVDGKTDVDSNKIMLNITVADCPNGFKLSESMNKCQCENKVVKMAKCFPSSLYIERSGRNWIGYNQQLQCTIVNYNCPFDYCLSQRINVTLQHHYKGIDVQCAFNRADQLCGKCSDNDSLVLGSNACKDCNGKNAFIALIIPFALAGVVLVWLLLFFNLTVSNGTINGLIFVANVLKIYKPFLSSKPIPFLSQFISWINLDLGIETCFFDGMNAFYKVGLQFVFPFYLWLIIIMIIILSEYSSKAGYLVGNNGIQVLATLILLSYTKLIETVILIFSRVHIECGIDTTLYWYVDPTQEYLHDRHIILFAIAMVVVVVFITPYTLFLLLYPLTELLNDKFRRKLSWFLFKFKPFFDAYRGPHTNTFCIWPGMLLLVRIGLALVVALTEDQTISLGILLPLLVVIISSLSSGKIYKRKFLHILDGAYITLLIMQGFLAILMTTKDNLQRVLLYTKIATFSICCALLFGTCLFHFYWYTKARNILKDTIIRKLQKSTSTVRSSSMLFQRSTYGAITHSTESSLRLPLVLEKDD